MSRVHKFTFEIADTVEIEMPKGAKVLHVGQELGQPNNELAMWAEVDPGQDMLGHTFRVAGTGQPLPFKPGWHLEHIATVQARLGVWHVWRFER